MQLLTLIINTAFLMSRMPSYTRREASINSFSSMGWAGSELRASTAASTCSVKRGITVQKRGMTDPADPAGPADTVTPSALPKSLTQKEARCTMRSLRFYICDKYFIKTHTAISVSDQILQYRICMVKNVK